MRQRTFVWVGLIGLALGTGCGMDPDSDVAVDQEARSLEISGGATPSDAFSFFRMRRDERRCRAPACGGYWVSLVNKARTRCADGRMRAECYVAETKNHTALSMDEFVTALSVVGLTRGEVFMGDFGELGQYGVLAVSEIWTSVHETDPVELKVFRVRDRGIRCFRAPCSYYLEQKLNTRQSALLFELTGRWGSEAAAEVAAGPILVAGRNRHRSGGLALEVNEIYLLAKPSSSYCAEYLTADNRFYAGNFKSIADAEQWITFGGETVWSGYGLGSCISMNEKPCDPQDPPVCGAAINDDHPSDYASLCEFRKVVRAAAGTEGESKGGFNPGVCGRFCAVAVLEPPATLSPTYYARNFIDFVEADSWLGGFDEASLRTIFEQSCATPIDCSQEYAPVCGNIDDALGTYGNACEFQFSVMFAAGFVDGGEAQGFYVDGECGTEPGCCAVTSPGY